jgi:hypothetical protein
MNPQAPQPPQPRQPRARNRNQVQVIWTDVQCEYLLNNRMARNDEYWNLGRGERRRFWRDVAKRINEVFRTRFST